MISAKVNTAAGYVTRRIHPSLLTMLQAEAVKMEKTNFKGLDKYQKYLAGHLKHEYSLEHPSLVAEINKQIVECVELYDETFGSGLVEQEMKRGSNKTGIDYEIDMGPIWINFMQKYEFNPSHTHSGLFSYVIWIKVPYSLEEEAKLWDTPNKYAGCFAFQHLDCIGRFVTDIQESEEGGMVFFPANLTHTVFPFYTSDEFRVSVSGNVFLKEIA